VTKVRAATVVDSLHESYEKSGKSFKWFALGLESHARSILDYAKIASALERGRILNSLKDRLSALNKKRANDLYIDQIVSMLNDCYRPIVDDVMLLSAFELYARARLLRDGCVVHNIVAPAVLKKKQELEPVRVNSVRSAARKGQSVSFSEVSLGIPCLLKPRYRDKYPKLMSQSVLNGFEEVSRRANVNHFYINSGLRITDDLLAAVDYLDSVLPRKK
jgi:hypothetical protein